MNRSALTRATVLTALTASFVLVGASAQAATPTDALDGVISQVNDQVLYSPPLAPATTAVFGGIANSPLAPIQDGVNATYAQLKSRLGI